jgi:hypothetical protein
LAADGRSARSIAREVGVQPRIVSLWRHRYADHGLEGLNGELAHGGSPLDAPSPSQSGVLDGEIKQLQRRVVIWKAAACLDDLAQAAVQRSTDSSMYCVHSKPNGQTEPQTRSSPHHPVGGR